MKLKQSIRDRFRRSSFPWKFCNIANSDPSVAFAFSRPHINRSGSFYKPTCHVQTLSTLQRNNIFFDSPDESLLNYKISNAGACGSYRSSIDSGTSTASTRSRKGLTPITHKHVNGKCVVDPNVYNELVTRKEPKICRSISDCGEIVRARNHVVVHLKSYRCNLDLGGLEYNNYNDDDGYSDTERDLLYNNGDDHQRQRRSFSYLHHTPDAFEYEIDSPGDFVVENNSPNMGSKDCCNRISDEYSSEGEDNDSVHHICDYNNAKSTQNFECFERGAQYSVEQTPKEDFLNNEEDRNRIRLDGQRCHVSSSPGTINREVQVVVSPSVVRGRRAERLEALGIVLDAKEEQAITESENIVKERKISSSADYEKCGGSELMNVPVNKSDDVVSIKSNETFDGFGIIHERQWSDSSNESQMNNFIVKRKSSDYFESELSEKDDTVSEIGSEASSYCDWKKRNSHSFSQIRKPTQRLSGRKIKSFNRCLLSRFSYSRRLSRNLASLALLAATPDTCTIIDPSDITDRLSVEWSVVSSNQSIHSSLENLSYLEINLEENEETGNDADCSDTFDDCTSMESLFLCNEELDYDVEEDNLVEDWGLLEANSSGRGTADEEMDEGYKNDYSSDDEDFISKKNLDITPAHNAQNYPQNSVDLNRQFLEENGVYFQCYSENGIDAGESDTNVAHSHLKKQSRVSYKSPTVNSSERCVVTEVNDTKENDVKNKVINTYEQAMVITDGGREEQQEKGENDSLTTCCVRTAEVGSVAPCESLGEDVSTCDCAAPPSDVSFFRQNILYRSVDSLNTESAFFNNSLVSEDAFDNNYELNDNFYLTKCNLCGRFKKSNLAFISLAMPCKTSSIPVYQKRGQNGTTSANAGAGTTAGGSQTQRNRNERESGIRNIKQGPGAKATVKANTNKSTKTMKNVENGYVAKSNLARKSSVSEKSVSERKYYNNDKGSLSNELDISDSSSSTTKPFSKISISAMRSANPPKNSNRISRKPLALKNSGSRPQSLPPPNRDNSPTLLSKESLNLDSSTSLAKHPSSFPRILLNPGTNNNNENGNFRRIPISRSSSPAIRRNKWKTASGPLTAKMSTASSSTLFPSEPSDSEKSMANARLNSVKSEDILDKSVGELGSDNIAVSVFSRTQSSIVSSARSSSVTRGRIVQRVMTSGASNVSKICFGKPSDLSSSGLHSSKSDKKSQAFSETSIGSRNRSPNPTVQISTPTQNKKLSETHKVSNLSKSLLGKRVSHNARVNEENKVKKGPVKTTATSKVPSRVTPKTNSILTKNSMEIPQNKTLNSKYKSVKAIGIQSPNFSKVNKTAAANDHTVTSIRKNSSNSNLKSTIIHNPDLVMSDNNNPNSQVKGMNSSASSRNNKSEQKAKASLLLAPTKQSPSAPGELSASDTSVSSKASPSKRISDRTKLSSPQSREVAERTEASVKNNKTSQSGLISTNKHTLKKSGNKSSVVHSKIQDGPNAASDKIANNNFGNKGRKLVRAEEIPPAADEVLGEQTSEFEHNSLSKFSNKKGAGSSAAAESEVAEKKSNLASKKLGMQQPAPSTTLPAVQNKSTEIGESSAPGISVSIKSNVVQMVESKNSKKSSENYITHDVISTISKYSQPTAQKEPSLRSISNRDNSSLKHLIIHNTSLSSFKEGSVIKSIPIEIEDETSETVSANAPSVTQGHQVQSSLTEKTTNKKKESSPPLGSFAEAIRRNEEIARRAENTARDERTSCGSMVTAVNLSTPEKVSVTRLNSEDDVILTANDSDKLDSSGRSNTVVMLADGNVNLAAEDDNGGITIMINGEECMIGDSAKIGGENNVINSIDDQNSGCVFIRKESEVCRYNGNSYANQNDQFVNSSVIETKSSVTIKEYCHNFNEKNSNQMNKLIVYTESPSSSTDNSFSAHRLRQLAADVRHPDPTLPSAITCGDDYTYDTAAEWQWALKQNCQHSHSSEIPSTVTSSAQPCSGVASYRKRPSSCNMEHSGSENLLKKNMSKSRELLTQLEFEHRKLKGFDDDGHGVDRNSFGNDVPLLRQDLDLFIESFNRETFVADGESNCGMPAFISNQRPPVWSSNKSFNKAHTAGKRPISDGRHIFAFLNKRNKILNSARTGSVRGSRCHDDSQPISGVLQRQERNMTLSSSANSACYRDLVIPGHALSDDECCYHQQRSLSLPKTFLADKYGLSGFKAAIPR